MRPDEIWRAHWDGSWDALLVDGVPQAIAIEGLEAAAQAAGIRLGLWMLTHHRQWCSAGPQRRRQLLQEGLGAAGLSALSGAGLSLVLSFALAMVPGGQIWLAGLGVLSLLQSLPSPAQDPFRLSPCFREDPARGHR